MRLGNLISTRQQRCTLDDAKVWLRFWFWRGLWFPKTTEFNGCATSWSPHQIYHAAIVVGLTGRITNLFMAPSRMKTTPDSEEVQRPLCLGALTVRTRSPRTSFWQSAVASNISCEKFCCACLMCFSLVITFLWIYVDIHRRCLRTHGRWLLSFSHKIQAKTWDRILRGEGGCSLQKLFCLSKKPFKHFSCGRGALS